eukprot:365613-Chlamydomonas_euryale.AAC.7
MPDVVTSQGPLASSRGEPQDATRQPGRDPAVAIRPRSESNRGRADTRAILRDQCNRLAALSSPRLPRRIAPYQRPSSS